VIDIEVMIKPLTADLINDFLNFFDNIGFTDNPDWSKCYCYFHHCPGGPKVFRNQTKDENRAASIHLIESGILNGFLAFSNDKPVGWSNADSKESYLYLPVEKEAEDPDEGKIASIVCFLIAPAYRKQGIARKILKEICSSFKSREFKWIEAYPRKNVSSNAHNYHGPYSLYNSAGFTVFKEFESMYIMRKML